MNTIRQPCPACGRTLELPREAIGRLGKCPACEATFTIGDGVPDVSGPASPPESRPPEPLNSEPLPPETLPSALGEALGSSSELTSGDAIDAENIPTAELLSVAAESSENAGEVTPPLSMSGEIAAPQAVTPAEPVHPTPADSLDEGFGESSHPFSAPLPSGTTEALPPGVYVPSTESKQYTQSPEIGETSIERVISPTLAIFGERWPSIVMSFLIVVATMLFVILIPILVIRELSDAGGDTAAMLLTLIWVPVLVAMFAASIVGLARVALALARNASPSPMAELVPPIPIVVRFFVGTVLMTLLIGGLTLLFAGTMAALSSVADNEQLSALLSVFAAIVMATAGFFLQWLLWAWLFVVSDGKGTTIGSLRTAIALTRNNKLTSLFMLLIAVVMSAIGTAMCGVGHIVTGPFIMLMFAVGYLKMTEQPIDDPNRRATGA